MTEKLIKEGRTRPKIGVVIGSGGVKSIGGIELFNQLQKHEIPIDLIVGCSGGALIGAMVAMGFSIEKARMIASSTYTHALFSLDYKAIGGMLGIPFMKFDESMAIFKRSPLEKIFDKVYHGMYIEQSKIPLLIQTTDLQTGEGVVLSSGSCPRAIQASSAAVPFLPPCLIEDRWLIDGAFSQPLPIMEAVRANMDIIIAMSFHEMPRDPPTNFMNLALHLLNKTQRNAIYTQTGKAISFHHHEIIFVPMVFDHFINLWEGETIPVIYKEAESVVINSMQYIEKAIHDFYQLEEEKAKKL